MRTLKTAAVILAAAAATLPLASAASAAPLPPKTVTAATFVQDRPDGGNAGYWADDTMIRVLTITRTGGTPGHWTFTARLTDQGGFETVKGAQVPNQAAPWTGDTIKAAVPGLMRGWADFSFTATSLPAARDVPRTENDHGTVPADSTSTWYELAFPAGTTFGGAGIGAWSWSYAAFTPAGLQQWTDSLSNGYGDLAGDGQVTG